MRAAAFTAVSLLATVLGAAEIDPRSHEVLDLSCVSEIGPPGSDRVGAEEKGHKAAS